MSCITFIEADSLVHRLDPRIKLLVAFTFSIFIAISQAFTVLCSSLFCSILLAAMARLPLRSTLKRLSGLNLFMLMLWILLPITTPGTPLYGIGPFKVSREGIMLAAGITLKGNAIVLLYTALLSTIEIANLGHALSHLHVPSKLAHLFLFTIRYIDTLHHEYERLATAMKIRCFRPQMNIHSYRSIGYLVAMLLTRSLDRSERIIAAMKCRGFNGRFYVFNHFAFQRRDLIFSALSLGALVILMWIELS